MPEPPTQEHQSFTLPQALEHAATCFQQGRLAEAEYLCRQILGGNPGQFDALHILGAIRLQQRNNEEGVKLLATALRANPNSVDALSNLAFGLTQLKRYAEAIGSCDRALAIQPDHSQALNNRGIALGKLNRHEQAIASYDRALATKPDYVNALFNRGLALERLHRNEEAIASYDRALAISPDSVEVLFSRGNALGKLNRPDEAIANYERALALQPDYVEALNNRGLALDKLHRYDEAIASYDRALGIKPDYVEALINRGLALERLHRHHEAVASYDRALAIRPNFTDALFNRGVALGKLNRYQEALASYDRALAISPNSAEVLFGRGHVLANLNRPDEAIASYDRALALQPDYVDALNNRGLALDKLDRHDDAIASYDRALAIKPDHAEVLLNRGVALDKLDRHEEAIASYDRALTLKPGFVEALHHRGLALANLNRHEEAIISYDRALLIKPELAEALHNRGLALGFLNRHEEAIASYDRALSAKPEYTEALHNRGVALGKLNRYSEALASYDKALALNPDLTETLHNRGLVLGILNRHEEAIASHERVLTINPENPYTPTELAECRLAICRWDETDRLARQLDDHVVEGKSIITPFVLLHYGGEPSRQLLCARQYLRDAIKMPPQPLWAGTIYRHDKIRIAYLSADFYPHATAFLIRELFELHDRTRFEVVGISFGPDDKSELRSRLAKSFDRFHDVRAKSDQDVAALLNDLEIDIAVDLKGHTTNARPAILAYRPAPIQVSYLGYPGTTGAEFIDYVIADKVVLPFDQQAFYTEKIAHLPECYQVNDSKRPISPHVPTRSEVGLPEEGLVFCCFNNSRKITAPVFDVWMRLLRAVEGSVLWLLRSNDAAAGNLRREAEARGVDAARLVFAGKLSLEDHLARHRLADLFLDTLPVNAHTTASDALWAGLPVLTCVGTTFAGRVGASLLYAVGLPELVTRSLEDYEALAVKLASEPALLDSLRRKLQVNRLGCPLFDSDRFRRHIEAAYTTMWELWQRGESPRSFSVDPSQVAQPDG